MRTHLREQLFFTLFVYVVIGLIFCGELYSESYSYKEYTTSEFKNIIVGKNKNEVKGLIGPPNSTSGWGDDDTGYWSYRDIKYGDRLRKETWLKINAKEELPNDEKWTVRDEYSGNWAYSISIMFKNGNAEKVSFNF